MDSVGALCAAAARESYGRPPAASSVPLVRHSATVSAIRQAKELTALAGHVIFD